MSTSCTARCPSLAPGSRLSHCSACHETFGGIRGFDLHRAGRMDARRCLTRSEIGAVGIVLDSRSVWRTAARFEEVA